MRRKAFIGWGLGSFTSSALVSAVSLLYLRFMTDSLGLAMALAGLLVVVSKVYDAVLDPLMGILSDGTSTRWGRYRPWLLGGSLVSALALVLLFNVPRGLAGTALAAFCCFTLLLYSTGYTMYRIPYLALGRAITRDFDERSKLMTFSVYGSSFGGLAATAAAPWMLSRLGSDRAAHELLAWLLAGLVAVGGIGTFLLVDAERADAQEAGKRHFSLSEAWAALRDNRAYQGLIAFKVIMFAGIALHGTAIPFYTRHVLRVSDAKLASIFLVQTLAMMGSQQGWVWLVRRIGRRQGLTIAAAGQALSMLAWWLLSPAQPMPWVQILSAVEGVFAGGIFFGLYTVLADTMEMGGASGKTGREGIYAGVFVMVEKVTAALGTFIFSSIMGWAGFISSSNAGSEQSASVIHGIVLAISVLPAMGAGVACLALRWMPPTAPQADKETRSAPMARKAAAACAMMIAVGLLAVESTPARAADTAAPAEGGITIPRIYAGADGASHLDTVTLPRAPGADPRALIGRLNSTDVEIGVSPPGTFIDWHRVSTPRLLVVLQGTLEVGLGDGSKHLLHAGDIALAQDLTGQGHTSRTVGTVPAMAMTVRLPKDDPLASRASSCPAGVAAKDCVANSLNIKHNDR